MTKKDMRNHIGPALANLLCHHLIADLENPPQ